MLPLPFRSASDLVAAARRRKVSAVELLELYVERMEKHDPPLI